MRIGRFQVSGAVLRNTDLLIALQTGMAVVQIDNAVFSDVVSVTAVGPMFREREDGEMIPDYEVVVNDDGHQRRFEFREKN